MLGAVVHNAEEVDRALLMTLTREPNGGLVVPSGPASTSHQALVIALAAQHWLPAVYPKPGSHGRASSTMLKGPCAARRTWRKPPSLSTSANLASPAWAPRASPTSWASEVGTQIMVEAL